jgi:hypothetical protein
VKYYVGKYIAKKAIDTQGGADVGPRSGAADAPVLVSIPYLRADGSEDETPGRQWGIIGRDFVPLCDEQTAAFAPGGEWQSGLAQLAREFWPKLQNGKNSERGFTLYFRDPSDRQKWENVIVVLLRGEATRRWSALAVENSWLHEWQECMEILKGGEDDRWRSKAVNMVERSGNSEESEKESNATRGAGVNGVSEESGRALPCGVRGVRVGDLAPARA